MKICRWSSTRIISKPRFYSLHYQRTIYVNIVSINFILLSIHYFILCIIIIFLHNIFLKLKQILWLAVVPNIIDTTDHKENMLGRSPQFADGLLIFFTCGFCARVSLTGSAILGCCQFFITNRPGNPIVIVCCQQPSFFLFFFYRER